MTDESKSKKAEQQVEDLELNRETIQDLAETQAEKAGGGRRSVSDRCGGGQCSAVETGGNGRCPASAKTEYSYGSCDPCTGWGAR